jgi:peroxiredoxin
MPTAKGRVPLLAAVLLAAVSAWYWFFERPPATPVIGRPAPSFQLPTLDGQLASLGDFKGRPVIVNFWATWCEPCKQEMPALQAEAASHPSLMVLGIDNVESPVKVKPFVEQLGVTFPILLDEDGSMMERYQVTGLPTSYFIDGSGVLRFIYRGALTDASLRQGLASIGVG